MRRLLSTLVLLGLGLTLGYWLWGSRVAALTESLNRMTLEADILRSRLVGASSAAPAGGEGCADDRLRLRRWLDSCLELRKGAATDPQEEAAKPGQPSQAESGH